MDPTVEQFYAKNADQNYRDQYNIQHGGRIDFVIREFGLDKIINSRVVDIGCGLGNYFSRMDKSNTFFGFDGAIYGEQSKLCEFISLRADLNTQFAAILDNEKRFDLGICSETLEHTSNPYVCIEEIKKLVKQDGLVVITTPALQSEHNLLYPALFGSRENMEQFFGQMALEVIQYKLFTDGWHTHCWLLCNKSWEHSKMLFHKSEDKFRGKTPLEAVNI